VSPYRPLKGSYSPTQVKVQVGHTAAGVNIETDVNGIAEPGYLDWALGQYTLARTANPEHAGKKAFRHWLQKGMSYRQDPTYQSGRASIMSIWGKTNPQVLHHGVPCNWTAFALYVDAKTPCDGSGDGTSIMRCATGAWSCSCHTRCWLRGGADIRRSEEGFRKVLEAREAARIWVPDPAKR
jgi:hypothetical protein